MICDLEARIEDLQQEILTKIDPQNEASSARYDMTIEPPSTPPQLGKATDATTQSPESPLKEAQSKTTTATSSSKSPLRPTSFQTKTKRSSVALRSLYASGNPSFTSLARPSSIFSDEELVEELDRQMLASPRLSILSESGFSSIYGHNRNHEKNEPVQDEEHRDPDQFSPSNSTESAVAQRQARISDWVEESKIHERSKTPPQNPSQTLTRGRFSSIDAALGKDVPPVPPHRNPLRKQPSSHISSTSSDRQRSEKAYLEERSPTKSLRKSARAHEKLSSHGGSVFGGNKLPPTPETMSTATIDASSSSQSILTERSQADGPAPGYAPYRRDRSESSVQTFVDQPSNDLINDDDGGFETSDEEVRSTEVERSQPGSPGRNTGLSGALLTVKTRQRSARNLDPGARPALTTYPTDVLFNGDGFSPKEPSRGISYPAPTGASPRLQNNLSPNSQRSSDVPSERTVTSPQSRPQTPLNLQPTVQDTNPPRDPEVKTSRNQSSLRFRLPRLPSSNPPPSTNTSQHQPSRSVTSRMFRRNTQATANPVVAPASTPPPRPSSRPRLPRPTSLYGQRSSSHSSTSSICTVPRTPRLQSMLPDDIMLTESHMF